MNKKKWSVKKGLIVKALLLIVVIYFFMTPLGALRLSIACNGYPLKAMMYPLGKRERSLEEEKNERVYAL